MSSDTPTTDVFWHRVDDVITLANKQVSDSNIGEVSSSLLYAVARFNAFNVANTSNDGTDMQSQKDNAIKHFTDLYKNLLEENFDEYVQNFESYRS